MFDIGWSEMAIIMLLALIIIGPKDLPRVARTIGQWVRKGRSMAREFQTSLEDMARDTELDDVRKEIEKVGKTDFKKTVENTIDPKGDLAKAFDTTAISDKAETKPALINQSDDAGKKTSANGHANGKASPPTGTSASVETKTDTPPAKKTAAVKAPASKSNTGKTAAKKAPAKKPVSAAKRSAKPAASASSPKTVTGKAKTGTATKSGATNRSADPTPSDEGGGTDQATIAAKPS